MKRYCFDTSGISNPLQAMPEDIHDWIWILVRDLIEEGSIAVTTEIYDEMTHIGGQVGACIRANRKAMVLEVGDTGWDWSRYIQMTNAMQSAHREYISEFNEHVARTVGMNDISIIALAKALRLPLVSMETLVLGPNAKKRKIPNVCAIENVDHLDFTGFLRSVNARR